MIALIWSANVLGWPIIQFGVGLAFMRFGRERFANDSWLTAPRPWERDGRIYRDVFAVRKWKSKLPDGGPWLGGFSKKKVLSHDALYFAQFVAETRRSELSHWFMLCCLPVFFVWNPAWACLVMTVYAIAANVPCIITQRYNRLVMERMLRYHLRADTSLNLTYMSRQRIASLGDTSHEL